MQKAVVGWQTDHSGTPLPVDGCVEAAAKGASHEARRLWVLEVLRRLLPRRRAARSQRQDWLVLLNLTVAGSTSNKFTKPQQSGRSVHRGPTQEVAVAKRWPRLLRVGNHSFQRRVLCKCAPFPLVRLLAQKHRSKSTMDLAFFCQAPNAFIRVSPNALVRQT